MLRRDLLHSGKLHHPLSAVPVLSFFHHEEGAIQMRRKALCIAHLLERLAEAEEIRTRVESIKYNSQ